MRVACLLRYARQRDSPKAIARASVYETTNGDQRKPCIKQTLPQTPDAILEARQKARNAINVSRKDALQALGQGDHLLDLVRSNDLRSFDPEADNGIMPTPKPRFRASTRATIISNELSTEKGKFAHTYKSSVPRRDSPESTFSTHDVKRAQLAEKLEALQKECHGKGDASEPNKHHGILLKELIDACWEFQDPDLLQQTLDFATQMQGQDVGLTVCEAIARADPGRLHMSAILYAVEHGRDGCLSLANLNALLAQVARLEGSLPMRCDVWPEPGYLENLQIFKRKRAVPGIDAVLTSLTLILSTGDVSPKGLSKLGRAMRHIVEEDSSAVSPWRSIKRLRFCLRHLFQSQDKVAVSIAQSLRNLFEFDEAAKKALSRANHAPASPYQRTLVDSRIIQFFLNRLRASAFEFYNANPSDANKQLLSKTLRLLSHHRFRPAALQMPNLIVSVQRAAMINARQVKDNRREMVRLVHMYTQWLREYLALVRPGKNDFDDKALRTHCTQMESVAAFRKFMLKSRISFKDLQLLRQGEVPE